MHGKCSAFSSVESTLNDCLCFYLCCSRWFFSNYEDLKQELKETEGDPSESDASGNNNNVGFFLESR